MSPATAAALWTAAEAEAATGGRSSAGWAASGISIDSRTAAPGDLFIAIEGANSDGHDYVADALAAGAAAAMVSRHPRAVSADAPLLRVADTAAALRALATAARARASAQVIAVTGSVGKTSTKEALRRALSSQAAAHASAASYNNHWGVPLSLARMPADSAFGIFELGMSRSGELDPLSRMVRPHAAIVTGIAPAHLAYFKNLAAIADAKAEVFAGLEPEGTALLNRDSEFFPRLAQAAEESGARRVLGFGRHPEAWAHIAAVAAGPCGSEVSAQIGGRSIEYRIGAAGEHWVMNSLATLAAVAAFGGDLARAAESLADMAPLRGRGARHRIRLGAGTAEVIDESYNANPASMRAAIATLAGARPGPGGRRIAVLGDMLELGPDSVRLHAGLAADLAAAAVDIVLSAGADMAHLDRALPESMARLHAERSHALAPPLLDLLRPGDVVMVKGSFGIRMGAIVEALLERGRPEARAECG